MNTDLQNALYKAWPRIFRQKALGPADTSMCWGIQCGDGWAGLIGALCEVTTAHARTGAHPVPVATTVKQKFASLRVHFDQHCEFCDGARRLVEAFSKRICEVTGRPGVRCTARGGGVKTLAPDIAVRLGFEVDQPEPPQFPAKCGVPVGWQGIADSLVAVVAILSPSTMLRFEVGDDGLRVTPSENSDQRVLGAAACAVALSRRTEADSGQVLLRR
jgi:hypothetical protein